VTTGSTAVYTQTLTTTSALSGGGVYLMAENRGGSLVSTTYMYMNASFFLID
jgi:hypothetical protein